MQQAYNNHGSRTVDPLKLLLLLEALESVVEITTVLGPWTH